MKLLVVTQAVDRSHPILGFFIEWLEEIAKHPRVHSLHVICFDRADTSVSNARITRLHGNRFMRVWRFLVTIWRDDADIVFVHMTPIWLIVGWIMWSLKGTRKTLWFTHGVATISLRIAVILSDNVFTATKKAFPIYSNKVVVIGHAISSVFRHVERLPKPEKRFAILAVGRVMSRKRVVETIRFFSLIRAKEPTATLDWAGTLPDGQESYRIEIERSIDALRIRDAVRFLGVFLPQDMPKLYAAYDLLLHLSDTGSLDKVVFEALASGCPVFSTNPATAEGVGVCWYWNGALDESAALRAIQMMQGGVSGEEQQRIRDCFELHRFIEKLVCSLDKIIPNKHGAWGNV